MALPTPVNRDNYSRFFGSLFDERRLLPMAQGFQAFFGQNAQSDTVYTDDLVVNIPIIRAGAETLAQMKRRGSEATSVGGTQKMTQTGKGTEVDRMFPLIEKESGFSATRTQQRMTGEPSGADSYTPKERARIIANNFNVVNGQKIARTFEYLAATVFRTGEMPIIIGATATEDKLDFYRNAAMTATITTKWDNASGDPFADAYAGLQKLRNIGKTSGDFMGFGDLAAVAFTNNAKVKELSDLRRHGNVFLGPRESEPKGSHQRFVDAGWNFMGKIILETGQNLWCYNYGEVYDSDGAGTYTKFMTTDSAFICNTETRFDRFFGPPEVISMDTATRQFYQDHFGIAPEAAMPNILTEGNNVLNSGMMYFDGYPGPTRKAITARVQAAPIFAPVHTDSIYWMNSVDTA